MALIEFLEEVKNMYYLCENETQKALQGPFQTVWEVVAIITAKGPLEAQFPFCSASRYQLAKSGRYPRNKTGDTALLKDIAEATEL